MPAKTPSNEALERALAILIADVNQQTPANSSSKANDTLSGIDTTAALLHSLKAYIVQRLNNLASTHNSLLPINKLPAELSVSILLSSLAGPDEDPHLRSLRRLASVQTHWWHLIKGQPSFWTHISTNLDQKEMRIKLKRSQEAPLTIDCDTRYMSCKDVRRFMQQIEKHEYRWKSFRHRGPRINLVTYSMTNTFPELEHLELAPTNDNYYEDDEGEEYYDNYDDDYHYPNADSPLPYHFGKFGTLKAPKLKTVVLKSVILPLAQLSNLSSLTIEDIPDTSLLPTSLTQLIASSPGLQELVLRDIRRDEKTASEVPTDQPPVATPALKTLQLHKISHTLATLLLRTIVVSPTVDFSLTASCDEGAESTGLVNHLQRPRVGGVSLLRSLLSRPAIGRVKIKVGPEILQIKGNQVLIRLERLSWARSLAIIQSLQLDDAREVELTYEVTQSPLDPSFFQLWPNVVRLDIGCGFPEAAQMLENLTQDWLWPNLAGIRVLPAVWSLEQQLKPKFDELIEVRKASVVTKDVEILTMFALDDEDLPSLYGGARFRGYV